MPQKEADRAMRRAIFLILLLSLLPACSSSSDDGIEDFPEPFAPALAISVPGDFPTLAQAVAAASPGDTIQVSPGNYAGSALINKPLIIEGVGGTPQITATAGLPALLITAQGSNTTVKNLAFSGTANVIQVADVMPVVNIRLEGLQLTATSTNGVGISADNVIKLTILNNTITTQNRGVLLGLLAPTVDVTIDQSTFLLAQASPDVLAIGAADAPNLRLTNLRVAPAPITPRAVLGQFTGIARAILVERSDRSPVSGLVLSGLDINLPAGNAAISLFNTPAAQVSDCTIISSGSGLIAGTRDQSAVAGIVVERVNVTLANVSQSVGLNFGNCPQLRVRDCRVTQADFGIQVFDETTPGQGVAIPGVAVSGTTVESLVGGLLLGNCPSAAVSDCTLTANTVGFRLIDTATTVSDARVERVGVTLRTTDPNSVAFQFGNCPNLTISDCTTQAGQFGFDMVGGPNLMATRLRTRGSTLGGFRLQSTSLAPSITNSTFDGGENGIVLLNGVSQAVIEENVLTNHQFSAVGCTGAASGRLSRNRMVSCLRGVFAQDTSALEITNNLMLDGGVGVDLFGNASAAVTNNNIGRNLFGLRMSNQSAADMRNNIIFLNQTAIDATASLGTSVMDFNDLIANTNGDFPFGVVPGANDVSGDPLFVDFVDFVLQPTSPAIDLGQPTANFNDAIPPGQGTARNDLGAYGGPRAGTIPSVPPVVPRRIPASQLSRGVLAL